MDVQGSADKWRVDVPHCVGVPTPSDVPEKIQESDGTPSPCSIIDVQKQGESSTGSAVSTFKEGQSGTVVTSPVQKEVEGSTGVYMLLF